MDYNFIGLFLIFTNFFCNIIIKLQEYYITMAGIIASNTKLVKRVYDDKIDGFQNDNRS